MIKLINMSKKFGNHSIFENYNLTINEGEMVAIKGMSGCGKSTLLNIIGLLDLDFNGELELGGINTKKLSSKDRSTFIRNNINYLFQNYALIENESVYDNLLLALEYEKASKSEKLEKIKQVLCTLNLESKLNQKVYTLSGGEQQRVALARILLKSKKIILADEPTGNLDIDSCRSVLNLLKQLHQENHTIIIVTHDPLVASMCDKTIEL